MLRKAIPVTLLLLACSICSGKPIPVVFDTDIGSDIDDTWALLYILRSPELDLKMVLTDTADTHYRAKVTAKFLEVCERPDVSVGIGIPSKPDALFQLPYVEDYDLSSYPGTVHEDGVQAFIDLVNASEEPITLIVAGPVPNIAEALRRDPTISKKINFVGMHGSIDVGYNQSPEPSAEWNVASHVKDFQAVIAADWLSFKISPLDTCGHVILTGDLYQQVKASTVPALQALFENYRYWVDLVTWEKPDYYDERSSNLYDLIPVYMAYSSELLAIDSVKIEVDDKGYMHRSEDGHLIDAALQWKDLDAFYIHLAERLLTSKTQN